MNLAFPTMTITRSTTAYQWAAFEIPIPIAQNDVSRAIFQQDLIDTNLTAYIDGVTYKGRIIEAANGGLSILSQSLMPDAIPLIAVGNGLYHQAYARLMDALEEYRRVFRTIKAVKEGGDPTRLTHLVNIAKAHGAK